MPSRSGALGINFISYRENADTTTVQGKLIFGIMASMAEFERAADRRARQGGHGARQGPRQARGSAAYPAAEGSRIRRDLLAGRSLRSTIKAHGVRSKTVQRIKPELADEATASQKVSRVGQR